MIDMTSDADVLAVTVDGEAEDQPLVGKQAVASSVVNRAVLARAFKERHGYNHPQFGDGTIRGACVCHAQYDCWLAGPDYDRISRLDPKNPTTAFQECLDVAKAAVAGTLQDQTNNATHYFAISIAGPRWLYGARWRGQFGKHLFWGNVS